MYRLIFKRVLDFMISLCGVIVLLLPMIIISIAIKIDSNGPIFFFQKRLGRNKKEFTIYKFRTMCNHAYELGGVVFSEHDKRITKVGRFLRRTSLDEVPQLFNVILGERGIIETTKKNADFSRVVTVNSISL